MRFDSGRFLGLAILLCMNSGSSGQTTMQSGADSIRLRKVNTETHVLAMFGSMTNLRIAVDDRAAAVEAATVQSLQIPQAVASFYYPKSNRDGSMTIHVFWMEDKPTLKEVVVRNPENGKEQRLSIPQTQLDAEARDVAPDELIYLWFGSRINSEIAGDDPTQVLEISALGQAVPAKCYPSINLGGKSTTLASP
jgi:hypothetical protein